MLTLPTQPIDKIIFTMQHDVLAYAVGSNLVPHVLVPVALERKTHQAGQEAAGVAELDHVHVTDVTHMEPQSAARAATKSTVR